MISSIAPLLAYQPDITPDQGFFGVPLAEYFLRGITTLMIIAVVIGIILSAGLWAVGSFSNNYTQSINGKKGFLICAAAALAIGASAVAVNWFFGQGKKIGEGTSAP